MNSKEFTTNRHEFIRPLVVVGQEKTTRRYQTTGSWCLCGSWSKFIILFFLIILSSALFAQPRTQPWWFTLEQGKSKFRSGDYGGALLSFEDARRQRRAMYEQMERDFINFLSTREARILGDSLEILERFSIDRHYTAVNAALNELYYRVPKTKLNNSALAALTAIKNLKDYPEAEYWVGEVYRIEGELTLALSQYRKVYNMRELLDDTGFGVTLQYKISDILRVRQDYNEMERNLLSIIAEYDTLWANAELRENAPPAPVATNNRKEPPPVPYAQTSASFARSAMTNTLIKEDINRFLDLYRYNNSTVEQAHRLLGLYYAVSGRLSAQQHLMFAFLIQNTIIIEELKRRQFDFRLYDPDVGPESRIQGLMVLAQEINKNPMLLSYIEEVEYYKTIYYLGTALYRNGNSAIALDFWSFLASIPQAGEWQARAILQLRGPQLEPIIEMP